MKGKFRAHLSFLKWFKKFFFANERQGIGSYNPVEARNGQDIAVVDIPVKSSKPWRSSHYG